MGAADDMLLAARKKEKQMHQRQMELRRAQVIKDVRELLYPFPSPIHLFESNPSGVSVLPCASILRRLHKVTLVT